MSNSIRLVFPMLALVAVGCGSPGAQAPANAKVELLQTDRIVLRGNATADPQASCASEQVAAKHLLSVPDEMVAKIELHTRAQTAVLHVTHLESNKRWCVMRKSDGTMPTIPGEFASGTYAIGVSEPSADPYEVVFEKM